MRTILFTEPSTRNLWTRVWVPGLSLCPRRTSRTDTTLAGVTSLLYPGRSQLTGTLLPGKTEQISIRRRKMIIYFSREKGQRAIGYS